MGGQNSTSTSDKSCFSVVTVETRQGSIYHFPDVPRGSIAGVLPQSGRIHTSQPNLVLANPSGAALLIPFRVIKRVLEDEVSLWVCPA